jgi:hypothetical protein
LISRVPGVLHIKFHAGGATDGHDNEASPLADGEGKPQAWLLPAAGASSAGRSECAPQPHGTITKANNIELRKDPELRYMRYDHDFMLDGREYEGLEILFRPVACENKKRRMKGSWALLPAGGSEVLAEVWTVRW